MAAKSSRSFPSIPKFETSDPARATLRASGHAFAQLRVVSADGRVLLDSQRLGCTVRGEEQIYPLALDLAGFDEDASVEITLHGGYHN